MALLLSSQRSKIEPIVRHALGNRSVQLGDLYDATTGQIVGTDYDCAQLCQQNERHVAVPDITLSFSSSFAELRETNELELEGAVNIDFGIVTASGSAQYLSTSEIQRKEARIDFTVIRRNRIRSIPMEVLTALKPRMVRSNVTHFVCEITEGSAVNISFRQSCSRKETTTEAKAQLQAKFFYLFKVEKKLQWREKRVEQNSEIRTITSGPFGLRLNISSIEDLQRCCQTLPRDLLYYNEPLTVKFLPIQILCPDLIAYYRPVKHNLLRRLEKELFRAIENGADVDQYKNDVKETITKLRDDRNDLNKLSADVNTAIDKQSRVTTRAIEKEQLEKERAKQKRLEEEAAKQKDGVEFANFCKNVTNRSTWESDAPLQLTWNVPQSRIAEFCQMEIWLQLRQSSDQENAIDTEWEKIKVPFSKGSHDLVSYKGTSLASPIVMHAWAICYCEYRNPNSGFYGKQIIARDENFQQKQKEKERDKQEFERVCDAITVRGTWGSNIPLDLTWNVPISPIVNSCQMEIWWQLRVRSNQENAIETEWEKMKVPLRSGNVKLNTYKGTSLAASSVTDFFGILTGQKRSIWWRCFCEYENKSTEFYGRKELHGYSD